MENNRILITGSNGFIAYKLSEFPFFASTNIFYTSRSNNTNPNITADRFEKINLLEEFNKLEDFVAKVKPTHIIHTAAITQVDDCNNNKTLCYEVNVEISRKIAELCKKSGIHLIHFSTDFVYNGSTGQPYNESSLLSACNTYGKSKIYSEKAIVDEGCKHTILRVVLVYGITKHPVKHSFVMWVKNSLEKGVSIQVVKDHYRMPTWVDDIATVCQEIIQNGQVGIYNLGGDKLLSVYDFALEIADHWQLDSSLITPIDAKQIGQHTTRPKDTYLNINKAKKELKYSPTPIKEVLKVIDTQLNK